MARRVKTPNKQDGFEANLSKADSLALSLPDFEPTDINEQDFSTLDLSENLVDLESLSKEIALAAKESAQKDQDLLNVSPQDTRIINEDNDFSLDLKNEMESALKQNIDPLQTSLSDKETSRNFDHIFSNLDLNDDIFFNNGEIKKDPEKVLKPANDDKTGFMNPFSSSGLSSTLYRTTAKLSAAWAAGGVIVTGFLWPSDISFSSVLSSSFGWTALAGIGLPIALFWGGARFIKGAKEELHHVAHNVVQNAFSNHVKTAKEMEAEAITDNVRQEVVAMGRAIERTLERGSELEALVHGEVQNLERAYGENERRIHKLINELSGEREAILEHAERINNSLKNTRAAVSHELGFLTEDIARNVNNIAQALGETLEEKSQALFLNLKQASDNLAIEFLSKLEDTADMQINTNKDLVHALNQQLEDVHNNFRQNSSEFFNDFQAQIAHSEVMANKIGSQFYDTAEALSENFDKIFNKIDMSIDYQGQKTLTVFDEKISYFDQQTHNVVASLEDKFSKLDETILHRGQKTISIFDEHAENINNKSLSLATNFDKAATDTLNIFENKISHLDTMLQTQQQNISTAFTENNEAIEDHTNKLIFSLKERTDYINDTLKQHTENLSNVFHLGQNNFIEIIDQVKQRLQNQIDAAEVTIGSFFSERTGNLEESLAQNYTKLTELIHGETTRIGQVLQDNITYLSSNINTIEQSLTSNIGAIDNQIKTLDHSTSNLTGTLTNSFDVVQTALEQHSENINTRVDALRDSLSINSFELNKTLANQVLLLEERVERIRDLLTNGGTELTSILDQQYNNFEGVFSNRGEQIAASFSEYLNILNGHVNDVKMAIEHSTDVKTQLDDRLNQINHSFTNQIALLDQSTSKVQSTLDMGIQNVQTNLEQSALMLASSLRERIAEAAQIFSIEAKKAESIVDTIGGKLDHTLNQFGNEVSNVQNQLTHNTSNITENIKGKFSEMNDYVETKAEQTSQKIIQAGDYVASRLSQTSEQLSENLKQFSDEIEEKLLTSTHQNTFTRTDTAPEIPQLYGHLSNNPRGEDQVLKSDFSNNNNGANELSLLKNQLPEIMHDFKNHANLLNQAATLFNNLSEHFGTNIAEKNHTLSLFAQGLNKKNHETNQYISQFERSLSNFFKANHIDIRDNQFFINFNNLKTNFQKNAIKVQENLENLRNNLIQDSYHYGENAQFISNQAQQIIHNIQGTLYQQNQILKKFIHIANAISDASQSKLIKLIQDERDRENDKNASKSADFLSSKQSFFDQSHDINSQNYTPSAHPNETKNHSNLYSSNSSYSSDFANTDTLTLAKNQQRIIPTLQSMAHDIINAINHNKIIELWTYYRNGQRNIDPTQLYNPSGLLVFENVKRNYQQNLDFRQSANRYMEDFEKALNNVSEQHNKHSYQMRDYLISDTGKIYTMLAHAANRIQ